MTDIAPTRSAYTVKEHRRSIKHDIKAGFGPVRLDKLTARQLDDFHHDLLARGLSPSSVRRFHSVLHTALDRAVKWGIDPEQPHRQGYITGSNPYHGSHRRLSRTSSAS